MQTSARITFRAGMDTTRIMATRIGLDQAVVTEIEDREGEVQSANTYILVRGRAMVPPREPNWWYCTCEEFEQAPSEWCGHAGYLAEEDEDEV